MATIDLGLMTAIDLGLWPLLEGQFAQTLALFFALDPQVDVPHHITYEHLPVSRWAPTSSSPKS